MTRFVIFGGGLFFLATSVVGVRLLLLSRCRLNQPETALGLAFLIGGTLCGSLGQYVQIAAGDIAPGLMGGLVMLYSALSVVGITLYNTFTWRVFRSGETWAAAVVAGVFLSGLAMCFWLGASGVFRTGVQTEHQRAAMSIANAIGPIWATIESLQYYRMMKKRMALGADLGLADPIVTNRFLLWGLGSFFASAIVLSGLAPLLLDAAHPLAQLALLSIGTLGTAAAAVYALAFFPPKTYRAWLGAADAQTG